MARAQWPYDSLPEAATFDVTSDDVADGETLDKPQVSGIFGAGGEDVSPHLAWSGFPPETQSFVVTCFDPDAPTGSGFWHWQVVDIPASVTELPTGAGSHESPNLPDGAIALANDAGLAGFLGAAPPAGHGPHRYIFTVHAMGVPTIGVPPEASNAVAGFHMFGAGVLARATITAVYEQT